MQKNHKFTARTRMIELFNDDASLLSSISRFGIPIGFGDKTIQEACEAKQIDCNTFLAVINFIAEGNAPMNDLYKEICVETLINYLKNAHVYFLCYKLPAIRNKLISAVDKEKDADTYKVIFMQFFDEYFEEVRKHMDYEDKTVFPYVIRLLKGELNAKFRIADFEEHHTAVDIKLAELKKILVKYYPSQATNYELNDVLFDLLACEKDLVLHNQVEDFFFVPLIETIELQMEKKV